MCFFDLDHPNLTPLLNTWWSLIESGSHRDQISLPYAVAKTGAALHPILPPGTSTRSDPRFALITHTHKALTTAWEALANRELSAAEHRA